MKIGTLINQGKTKEVYELLSKGSGSKLLHPETQEETVLVISKDDITAGDGARHDVIAGKAAISNATTIAIFQLLDQCGIPLAFIKKHDETSFVASDCTMLPYEVVVRREAHGSHCKRFPSLHKGTRLPRLLVQFYLKTSGRKYGDHELPCDDPLMQISWNGHVGTMALYMPSDIAEGATPFRTLPTPEGLRPEDLQVMADIAARAFLVLEKAWQMQGIKLVDYKVEFGRTSRDRLVLSDVIDADSGRLVGSDGTYLDKQVYRDGGSTAEVFRNYLRIQHLAEAFTLPTEQTVVLWQSLTCEDISPFGRLLNGLVRQVIIRQIEADEDEAIREQGKIEQCYPNSVIIALAHPMANLSFFLEANAVQPVIFVSPDDDDPETASYAVRQAICILALRNPNLYMQLIASKPDYYEIG